MEDLSQKQDIELVEKIKKTDDNDALKELINRHSNIAHHIQKKYQPAMIQSGVANAQEFGEKDYLIYQAAKSYDPNRGTKYSSHLANICRYFCLNSMKEKKEVAVDCDALDYLIDGNAKQNHQNIENFYLNISYINNLIAQLKDDRTKKIFQLRYFHHKKLTWKQIAKRMKLSGQMCINLHNSAVKIIRTKMNSQVSVDTI